MLKNNKWQVRFTKKAEKELFKLDQSVQLKIITYLKKNISSAEDPKRYGKPLSGNRAEFWRYRINDYRLICSIVDQEVTVLVVHIGHRKEIYT